MLKERISHLANLYAPDLVAIRRHLHAHPELSYHEFETSKFVQRQLADMGIPFMLKANTGVIGLLAGKHPEKRVIALRADMDALPILEENDLPYKSKNEGVMHACGHDVHTTCLLGAARILHELRAEWVGTIKLIFQPGEEKNPGGASLLIKEGVLDNPRPSFILGLHVHPNLPVGKFRFRGGKIMASADELYITIKSKGGHAAAPQETADTILIASQLIVALQQIISRNNSPFSPSVLTITSFQGGNATNIIPKEVKLMGTFRAMDEGWRFRAHDLIRKLSTSLVEGMGAEIDITIDVGYPTVYNHEELNEIATGAARVYAGKDNIEESELRMGAEDFGYYSQIIPGCFFRLGAGNVAKGIVAGVHTPTFNIDEDAIALGAGMMAWLGATIQLKG